MAIIYQQNHEEKKLPFILSEFIMMIGHICMRPLPPACLTVENVKFCYIVFSCNSLFDSLKKRFLITDNMEMIGV